MSYPFVERVIGTIRREHFDQVFFWNEVDLKHKLNEFKTYFNNERTHASLEGDTPARIAGGAGSDPLNLDDYRWKKHCAGLFQLPVAA